MAFLLVLITNARSGLHNPATMTRESTVLLAIGKVVLTADRLSSLLHELV